MCLYIRSEKKPKGTIAVNDIVVYKILVPVYSALTERFTSPFSYFEWSLDKIYTAKGAIDLIHNGSEYLLEAGAFHSYAVEEQAYSNFNRATLFAAIIPKGTRYWFGVGANYTHQYASKSLKIVKPIKRL